MNTMNRGLLSTILALILPMGFLRLWVDGGGEGGDDGTDPGPGSDATSGTIGTGNDDRLRLLDQINDSNDRARAEELANVNDDGSTEAFVAPAVEGEEEGEPGTVAAAPAPAVPPAEPPAPEPTKIKVNGEEVVLTPELIAKAQKIASADQYLEQARKSTTTAAPAPAAEIPPPPTQGVEDRSEEDRALVRAIQMGTEEEALAALQKLRKTQPSITLEDVNRIADERLTFTKALDWFNDEFKDLVADSQLHSIVLARDAELVKAGDKRPYKERYEAIGNEVRTWRDEMVKKFGPAPAPAPAPAVDPKLERKQTAPKVPVVATAKATPPADDDSADENTSSVIANMAKSRGGPQWARG